MIIFIFEAGLQLPGLAHSCRHSVAGISLPPVYATLFIELPGLPGA